MLLVGSLTCKTVSRMTYNVLVETLNPTHSLTVSLLNLFLLSAAINTIPYGYTLSVFIAMMMMVFISMAANWLD